MLVTYESETVVGAQLISERRLAVLLVREVDDNIHESRVVEVDLGARDANVFTPIEFDGWLSAFWRDDHGRYFVGTVGGEIYLLAGDEIFEFVAGERAITSFLGVSADEVYSTTIDGRVLGWDGQNWADLNTGGGDALLKITMDSRGRLLAAGEEARLIQRDEGQWKPLSLPTNLRLGALDRAGAFIYVGGDRGVCYCLDSPSGLIEIVGTSSSIYGFAKYRGCIYSACSTDGIMEIKADELVPVATIIDAYGLCANSQLLVAYGNNEVAVFDGSQWSVVTRVAI